jgi:hypothetical protein
MLRYRKFALLSSAACTLALAAAPALAQTTPMEQEQDDPVHTTTTDDTGTTTTEVEVQPSPVIVQPQPPAPVVVEQPPQQPVIVEEQPVNVIIAEEPRSRAMTLSVGGGVSDFTDSTLRNRTGLNAAYEARLSIGINSPLAIEAAYVGTASEIDSLGLDDEAMLISNGVEGLARLNLGTFDVQPYVVGGASWVRYNVVNTDFNSSDVRDEDDVLAVPLGGGVSTYLGDSGFMLDARFTYRMMFDDDLVRPTPDNSDGSAMDNWMVTAKLGYAF